MNTKRAAKTQPKAETPESGEQDVIFRVHGLALQKTVELLAGLPMAHPTSIQRDQLVAYYTQLKAEGHEDAGTGKT